MLYLIFFHLPPRKRLKTARGCVCHRPPPPPPPLPREVYDSLSLAERKPSFSREEGTERFARACLVKFSALARSYKGSQT